MRFLIRVLIIFAVVLAVMSAIRGMLSPTSPKRRADEPKPGGGSTGKLVRDPICGTYVASSGSIHAIRDSETYHFCSDECREKFLQTGT